LLLGYSEPNDVVVALVVKGFAKTVLFFLGKSKPGLTAKMPRRLRSSQMPFAQRIHKF